MAMLNPNIMALLQSSMSSSPFGVGPVAPQNPTPGFRAAPMGAMPQVPRMQPQDNTGMQNGMGMLGLAGAMQRLNSGPVTPGAAPTGGYTTANLMASGLPGATAGFQMGPNGSLTPGDPTTPTGGNGFIDFLTGLKTRLFS